MQTLFYVSRAGQRSGPWTIDEIAQRLARAELAATDFLYDEASSAWVPFLESKPLVDAIKKTAPAAPPPTAEMAPPPKASEAELASDMSPPQRPTSGQFAHHMADEISGMVDVNGPIVASMGEDGDAPEWLVKRAARVYGPFTYFGLIRALQEKSVFEFDLVRKSHEGVTGEWTRIAEREEFHRERLRSLIEAKNSPARNAFVMRRFVRRPVEQDALVHDNKKTWIGKTFEGSEGGCGIVVRNSTLAPGQVVHIHFGRTDGLAPFNALCEVVNKRYSREARDARAPVQYGVKFLQIDPRAVQAARDFYVRSKR